MVNEWCDRPDHADVPRELHGLTAVCRAPQSLDESERLSRGDVAFHDQSHGPKHHNVGSCLTNLADVLRNVNRMAEAEPLLWQALAIDEAWYGTDHPDVARDLNNLASLFMATDRLAEAEPLNRRRLEIFLKRSQLTGYEHPQLRVAGDSYAGLLAAMGMKGVQISDRLNEIGRPFSISLSDLIMMTAKPSVACDLFISYSRRNNGQGPRHRTEGTDRSRSQAICRNRWPRVAHFSSTLMRLREWMTGDIASWAASATRGCSWSASRPPISKVSTARGSSTSISSTRRRSALLGEGVAPIYFVEVPGWYDKDYNRRAEEWVVELRRRQHIDLCPWFNQGAEALKDAAVQTRMDELNRQIRNRLGRITKVLHAKGNVDRHNEHFKGRTAELRRLREQVGLGKFGVLTAVHGLGGMGKTALAVEYAYAFAPRVCRRSLASAVRGARGSTRGDGLAGRRLVTLRLNSQTMKRRTWTYHSSGCCASLSSVPTPRVQPACC